MIGVAIGHDEIVAALLHGQFGRAIKQIFLDRVARRVAVAAERHLEAVRLDLVIAIADPCEARARGRAIGRFRGATGEKQST
jgi:hypothetical protein